MQIGGMQIGVRSCLLLEQWLKQTRYGTRPADWSYKLSGTLEKLYQVAGRKPIPVLAR